MKRKSSKSKIVVVLGPTATGKSDLAVKIAKKFNGEVISADSRQVYKDINIGSDKITEKEMKGVWHHLLSVVPLKKTLSVVHYKLLAKKAIREIVKRGRLPVICGGTGLYIDALLNDWRLPQVKPNLKLREELESKSVEELFENLKKLDPARAGNIDPHNKRRLVRALEIVIQTGKPIGTLRLFDYTQSMQARGKNPSYEFLKIGIKVAPEELKKRIRRRTLKRLREGVIREMENLKKSGVSQKRLNDISLYYRWVGLYLRGEMNQEKTLDLISIKIWQYAKRQMTWFKRDISIYWISKNTEAERLIGEFLK